MTVALLTWIMAKLLQSAMCAAAVLLTVAMAA